MTLPQSWEEIWRTWRNALEGRNDTILKTILLRSFFKTGKYPCLFSSIFSSNSSPFGSFTKCVFLMLEPSVRFISICLFCTHFQYASHQHFPKWRELNPREINHCMFRPDEEIRFARRWDLLCVLSIRHNTSGYVHKRISRLLCV